MAFESLHFSISLLEDRDQLVRVRLPLSSILEMTEITDRVCKGPAHQNKALLFENLPGYQIPVLINALGSEERMAWALGVQRLDELNSGTTLLTSILLGVKSV